MSASRTPDVRTNREATVGSPIAPLVAALKRLDNLLISAVEAMDAAAGENNEAHAYRGLYLASSDVHRALLREPGAARFNETAFSCDEDPGDAMEPFEALTRFLQIARVFGLSSFDLAIVLIALAPEFDLKYERVYAYLQDDISRRRPSVDLALNLLCRTAAQKLARRCHFAPDSPLVLSRVMRLTPEPQAGAPLPSWSFRLDEQIVRFLLFQQGLDPRLSSCCRLTRPGAISEQTSFKIDPTRRSLVASVVKARKERQPLRLYFQGPRGAGQAAAVASIALEAEVQLLTVDLDRLPTPGGRECDETIRVLIREALFQGAILFIDQWDSTREPGVASPSIREIVGAELASFRGVAILCGEKPWEPPPAGPKGVVTIPFEIADFSVRRSLWKAGADAAEIALSDADLDALANLYKLDAEQIADATSTATATAAISRTGDSAEPFFKAARAQSGHALGKLARKIEPTHGWNDLILEDDAVEQLRELCRRVRHKRKVIEDWGFGQKIAGGGGTSALLSGPSGTGKTTAASIVAAELKLDIYEIDLSRVVSKYIGETEKNLRQIFEAAVGSNSILLINEAEALWGKRSEVRDAHDRYANIEIAFLLQEMELFEGVAILTTNLRGNLDDAFTRRLDFVIELVFPEMPARRKIWEVILPPQAPRGKIDLDLLAGLRLSGGNIKNVVYAAAYLAAAENSPIETTHLIRGVRREFAKLGRTLNEAELGPYAGLAKGPTVPLLA